MNSGVQRWVDSENTREIKAGVRPTGNVVEYEAGSNQEWWRERIYREYGSDLQCLGCDPTAMVEMNRIHKDLEPKGDRRGGVPACPTACMSSQRHGLPTLSWRRCLWLLIERLLGWAGLLQPLNHPLNVRRTAKRERLRKIKTSGVKCLFLRMAGQEQIWDFWIGVGLTTWSDSWGTFV